MNPYAATHHTGDLPSTAAIRSSRTYVDAALIGIALSFVAPVYFTSVGFFVFETPIVYSFVRFSLDFVPLAFVGVIFGIAFSQLVPQRVSYVLSRWQRSVPLAINSSLFSLFFIAVGYQYLSGFILRWPFRLSISSFAFATVVSLAVSMHIAVRPRFSS